ncbi:MAG: hypothetical protein AB7P33_11055 [Dehalococcoidia bacterium]
MLKRLSASLGLVLAAFAATTGVSSAAVLETRSDVMYAAGATVVVLLVLVTIAYTVKVATGWERNQAENPEEEDALHIRSSGYGGAYYDERYGGDHAHESHGNGHDESADSHGHGAPAAAHGHH